VVPYGTTLYTHGPDHTAAGTTAAFGYVPLLPPHCVQAGDAYYAHLIYARPYDKSDRYSSQVGSIRDAIARANGLVRMDAAELGRSLNLRILCEPNGNVLVSNVVLPTHSSQDSFYTIVSDLRARGYTDYRVKYWVVYDDSVGAGIAGQGSMYLDDRLILDNWNNGAPGSEPRFAIAYGTTSYSVLLHEAGHTMGAVQLSAPRSSGAGHCNDGQDIMCYADGGSKSRYNSGVCSDRVYFDCNHDDYFHPNPPTGSYLSKFWNLGSTLNRFIESTPTCDWIRIRHLDAGLLGVSVNGVSTWSERGIPSACHGQRFTLHGEYAADFDVCWYTSAGVSLGCSTRGGDEHGVVPQGAYEARITAFTALVSKYTLILG